MGKLWDIIEEWRDGMAYPPSYRKIAMDLQVSQSAFDTWKAPTEVPKPHNLLAISRLTGVPYRRVVDAAVEDAGLYDEARAEESAERVAHRKGKSPTRARRQAEVDEMTAADPEGPEHGA